MTTEQIINPFPKPDINEPETKEIVDWVKSKLPGLTFYDCLDKLKEYIDIKDSKRYKIIAHYTSNIIINSGMNKDEIKRIISDLAIAVEI